jgi:hypothetical protein
MKGKSNKLNKRISFLEQEIISSSDGPEFYGAKIFNSEGDAKIFEDKWMLENSGKKFKGKYFIPGMIIIMIIILRMLLSIPMDSYEEIINRFNTWNGSLF